MGFFNGLCNVLSKNIGISGVKTQKLRTSCAKISDCKAGGLEEFKDHLQRSGSEISCRHENGFKILHQSADDKNFSKIAHVARENKVDAIAIYSRTDRRQDIADFEGYKEIKEFNDNNKFIKIYVSISRLPSLENPEN